MTATMQTNEISIDVKLDGHEIPYIEQYFGPWMIEENTFRGMVRSLESLDLSAHLDQHAVSEPSHRDRNVPVSGGIARIELRGSLMKHVSSFSGGSSTALARKKVRLAAGSDDVQAILLVIDSPGGTVSGTFDLAQDVRKAATEKPVYAYCEDLCASAAYAIASQCRKVYANEASLIGSIGTLLVVHDLSKMAENEGVKVHAIKTGEFKGTGVPGTEITDEQLEYLQSIVTGMNSHFLAGVESGRSVSAEKVNSWADGRVHVAEEALKLGLIDGIKTIDEVLAEMREEIRKPAGGRSSARSQSQSGKGSSMTTNTAESTGAENVNTDEQKPQTKTPITVADIKGACPGADEKFIVTALESGHDLNGIRTNFMSEQSQRIEALTKERDDLQTKLTELEARQAEKPAGKGTKGAPLVKDGSGSEDGSSDPVKAFEDAVDARMKDKSLTKPQAVRAVIKENPQLHQEYIAAINANR